MWKRGLIAMTVATLAWLGGCEGWTRTLRISSDPGAYPPTPPPWDGHVEPAGNPGANPANAPPPGAGKK